MRYLLLLVLFLIVVGVLVGVGMYTPVGQGVVTRIFDGGAVEVLLDPSEEAAREKQAIIESRVNEIEDVSFVPDSFLFSVDFIEDEEDGYSTVVTRLEDGRQYEMFVHPSHLRDVSISLEVGDIIQVEVDSIVEREPPTPSILYPITITVEG